MAVNSLPEINTWLFEPSWVRRKRQQQELALRAQAAMPYVATGHPNDLAIAASKFTPPAPTQPQPAPQQQPQKKSGGGSWLGDLVDTVTAPVSDLRDTASDVIHGRNPLSDLASTGLSTMGALEVPARYGVRPAIKATTGLDVQSYLDSHDNSLLNNPFTRTIVGAATDPLTYLGPGAIKGVAGAALGESLAGRVAAHILEQPRTMAVGATLLGATGAQVGHELGGQTGETIGSLTGAVLGGTFAHPAISLGKTLIDDATVDRALRRSWAYQTGVDTKPLTASERAALARSANVTGLPVEMMHNGEVPLLGKSAGFGEYVGSAHADATGGRPTIYINDEWLHKPLTDPEAVAIRQRTIPHEEAHALWETMTPELKARVHDAVWGGQSDAAIAMRQDLQGRWKTADQTVLSQEAFAEAWASRQAGHETPYLEALKPEVDAVYNGMDRRQKAQVNRQQRSIQEWTTLSKQVEKALKAQGAVVHEVSVDQATGHPNFWDIRDPEGNLQGFIQKRQGGGYSVGFYGQQAEDATKASFEDAAQYGKQEVARAYQPFGTGPGEGGKERTVVPNSARTLRTSELTWAEGPTNAKGTIYHAAGPNGESISLGPWLLHRPDGLWENPLSDRAFATREEAIAQMAPGVEAGHHYDLTTREQPMANDRLWFHGTSKMDFDVPDPEKGVGQATAISQGAGIYLAADPKQSHQFGPRLFATEFDGKAMDMGAKPTPEDQQVWAKVIDDIKARLPKLEVRSDKAGEATVYLGGAKAGALRQLSNGLVKAEMTPGNSWLIEQWGPHINSMQAAADQLSQTFAERLANLDDLKLHTQPGAAARGVNNFTIRDGIARAIEPVIYGMNDDQVARFVGKRWGDTLAGAGHLRGGGGADPKGLSAINDSLANNGVDAFFYKSSAQGEVLVGLNGDKFRVRADMSNLSKPPEAGETLAQIRARQQSLEAANTKEIDHTEDWYPGQADTHLAMSVGPDSGIYTAHLIGEPGTQQLWQVWSPTSHPAGLYTTREGAIQAIRALGAPKRDVGPSRFFQAPTGDERFRGAPKGINDEQGVQNLVNDLAAGARAGERGRWWYQNSGREILRSFNGDVDAADRFAQALAIMSQGKGVPGQTPLTLRAVYQRLLGQPWENIGADKFQLAKLENVFTDPQGWQGRKTSNFYRALLKEISPEKYAQDFGDEPVIDVWMMRALGYDTEKPTPAQYDFAQQRLRDVANVLGWSPDEVQAAIWVNEKAKAAEAGHTRQDALGRDFADILRNNLAQVSWETTPGKTSGMLPDLAKLPYQERAQYHQEMSGAFLDENGHDILAQVFGAPSPGSFDAPGVYKGQYNPGSQTEFYVPGVVGSKAETDAAGARVLDAYAAARGFFLKQDEEAWTRLFKPKSKAKIPTDANAVSLKRGRILAPEEAASLDQALAQNIPATTDGPGHAVVSSRDGAWILNIGDMDNVAFQQAVESSVKDGMEGAVSLAPAVYHGNYFANDWRAAPDGGRYVDIVRRALSAEQWDALQARIAPRVAAVESAWAEKLRARGLDAGTAGAGPLPNAADRLTQAIPEGERNPEFVGMAPHELAHIIGIDKANPALYKEIAALDTKQANRTITKAETLQRDAISKRLREEYSNRNGGQTPVWPMAPGSRQQAMDVRQERVQKMRDKGMSDADIVAALGPKALDERRWHGSLRDYVGEPNYRRYLQLEKIASDPSADTELRQQARQRIWEMTGVTPTTPKAIAPAEAQIGDMQARQLQAAPASPGSRAGGSAAALRGAPADSESLGKKVGRQVIDVANLPRSLVSSLDVSGMGRQGLPLMPLYPKQWGNSVKTQLSAWKSEENALAIRAARAADPDYKPLIKAGIYEGDWRPGSNLNTHEEAFMSSVVGKIPGMGASQRAYVEGLNELRFQVAKKILNDARSAGEDLDPERLKRIANFVNVFTGRGDIKGLTDAGPLMNAMFFSPRFFASRLQMVWMALREGDPLVRKTAAKAMAAYIGTGVSALGLMAAAGHAGIIPGLSVEADPRSPDFGKVKLGNSRYDFWSGFQPLVRYTANFITGQVKSPGTGDFYDQTQATTLGKFLEGKLAPVPKTLLAAMRHETPQGEDYSPSVGSIGEVIARNTIPLFAQDVYDSIKANGPMGAVKALPSAVGIGYQDYAPNSQQLDTIAKNDYGAENYRALSPKDRQDLKDKHPDVWKEYVAGAGPTTQRAEALRDTINQRQLSADQELLSGQIGPGDWVKLYGQNRDELRYRLKEVYGDRTLTPGDVKTPLDAYYLTIQQNTAPDGTVDWNAVNQWQDSLPPEAQDYIDSNTGLGGTPLARVYKQMRSEYFDIPKYRGFTADEGAAIDAAWTEARGLSRSSDRKDMARAVSKLAPSLPAKVRSGLYRRLMGTLQEDPRRKRFRNTNPVAWMLSNSAPTSAQLAKLQSLADAA